MIGCPLDMWKWVTLTGCSLTVRSDIVFSATFYSLTESERILCNYLLTQLMAVLRTDTDLWDHPDAGTGVWGGISDGSPGTEGPSSQFICWSSLRKHRNQDQQAHLSVPQQYAPLHREYEHIITLTDYFRKLFSHSL